MSDRQDRECSWLMARVWPGGRSAGTAISVLCLWIYLDGMTQTVPGFSRLTVEPDKLGGQPCIRGYRFSVEQLLGLLADGLTLEQIQADYPCVEQADIAEVLIRNI
jgi:uncharacterized protein (DUF433 family)